MAGYQFGDARWVALGRKVFARRAELGMTSQQQLADAAGVHVNTVQKLEAGALATRRNPSWAKIEKVLAWEEGTIERVWRGEPGPGAGPADSDDYLSQVTRVLIDVAPELTGTQIRALGLGIQRLAVERGWVIVTES